MLRKVVTYKDFDDIERQDELWFNLTRTEVTELQNSEVGGLDKVMTKIAKTKDKKRILELIELIVLKSYGEKSPDGRRFIKRMGDRILADEFRETMAFDEIMFEFFTQPDHLASFIEGVLPELPEEAKTKIEEIKKNPDLINEI